MRKAILASILVVCLAACGGGGADSGAEEPTDTRETASTATTNPPPARPSGGLSTPEWLSYDEASNTVALTVVAGETPLNNHWNFNGHIRGEVDITVPVGATVTIEFINNDPVMAHSVGVSAEAPPFAAPPAPEPVFAGAISESPLSMTVGGLPGSTETISFVADEAGEYTLVCFVPGHSSVGMWIYFTVSAGGEAGVRGL